MVTMTEGKAPHSKEKGYPWVGSEMIIYELILTTFEASFIFWGS